MSTILHIETSTRICSVALSQDGQVIHESVDREGPSHAQRLAGFVSEALSFADSHAIPLDAVAVSKGPGSYTGLRIGVSMAKGVAYGRGAKLLSVPTLKLLCVPVLLQDERYPLPEDALLCPMIDARRMEVYCALYDRALKEVSPTEARVVDAEAFAPQLESGRTICFIGDGAAKCRKIITHPGARFIEGIAPLARYMAPLAEQALARGETEDVAYFEPYYLKDFVATKSKKLL